MEVGEVSEICSSCWIRGSQKRTLRSSEFEYYAEISVVIQATLTDLACLVAVIVGARRHRLPVAFELMVDAPMYA